ncbi:MAG: Dabb family protein [Clostridia bacterium]|nr:Dabb family protein [Clostridia bacterium]
MIKHIVCHNIPDKEAAQKAADMLNALYGVVPSLRSMKAGVDVLGSERSYALGIVAEFDDLDGLREYDTHPEHCKIRNYIKGVKDDTRPSVSCDFQF